MKTYLGFPLFIAYTFFHRKCPIMIFLMYTGALIWVNSPLNASTQISLTSSLNHLNCQLFSWQDNRTMIKVKCPSARSAILTAHSNNSPPSPPISQLYPTKVSAMLHCAISRCQALIEEHFPCICRNIFSVNSPCSSFNIAATHHGHTTTSSRWRFWWMTYKGNLVQERNWHCHEHNSCNSPSQEISPDRCHC